MTPALRTVAAIATCVVLMGTTEPDVEQRASLKAGEVLLEFLRVRSLTADRAMDPIIKELAKAVCTSARANALIDRVSVDEIFDMTAVPTAVQVGCGELWLHDWSLRRGRAFGG